MKILKISETNKSHKKWKLPHSDHRSMKKANFSKEKEKHKIFFTKMPKINKKDYKLSPHKENKKKIKKAKSSNSPPIKAYSQLLPNSSKNMKMLCKKLLEIFMNLLLITLNWEKFLKDLALHKIREILKALIYGKNSNQTKF